jgi:hypothetical protein
MFQGMPAYTTVGYYFHPHRIAKTQDSFGEHDLQVPAHTFTPCTALFHPLRCTILPHGRTFLPDTFTRDMVAGYLEAVWRREGYAAGGQCI